MSGLKEIRNRISSVSSTMQITNAMKMVSAAKLKKAQDSITATLPYSNKLSDLVKNISASIDSVDSNPLFVKREVKSALVIVITSNKGLCGGFNSNIIKEVYNISSQYGSKKPDLLTIGKKGNDILKKKFNVISSHNDLDLQGDYIFEPNREKILNELIPKTLSIQLFKSIADSIAGEHGARMTAMHKATDNATELRNQLKLTYNKARQAAITNEILEIVGGAEALNG